MYESGLKSSYNDVISAVKGLLTHGIQALQNRWKKCVNCKGTMLKKEPHFVTFTESILIFL